MLYVTCLIMLRVVGVDSSFRRFLTDLLHFPVPFGVVFAYVAKLNAKNGDWERSHRDLAGRAVSTRTLAARTGNGTPCPEEEAGRINRRRCTAPIMVTPTLVLRSQSPLEWED